MKYWMIIQKAKETSLKRVIYEDVKQPLEKVERKVESRYPNIKVLDLGYGEEFPKGFRNLPMIKL